MIFYCLLFYDNFLFLLKRIAYKNKYLQIYILFLPALINGFIDFVVILSLHTMYTSHVSGEYLKTVHGAPGPFVILKQD